MTDRASDEYGAELEDVVAHLSRHCREISIRGSSEARFVYAKAASGLVEISRSAHGEVFVEYWLSEDDAPIREATYPSYDHAIAEVSAWLSSPG